MDLTEQLKASLSDRNPEFRRLNDRHKTLATRIDEIDRKKILTSDEEAELHELKKEKLHIKDLMFQIAEQNGAGAQTTA